MKGREIVEAVLKHYRDCQLDGVKDVERQMEIYSDDSRFVVFPTPGVMGISDPVALDGKEAIRDFFEQYNDYVNTLDSITILHKNFMVDQEALKGSFVMEITMIKGEERHQYLNYLQMQLNEDMQVILSLNWQADVTGSRVLEFVYTAPT